PWYYLNGAGGAAPAGCGGPNQNAWTFVAASAPNNFWYKTRGVMGMDASVGMRQITDGTTKTIALTEIRTGISATDERGTWANGHAGASMLWLSQGGPNNCSIAD